MDLAPSAVLFAAGVVAGSVNAVAGGGTLLSFPALLWAGGDPIVANATNALALWPASLAGAFGFRRELQGSGRLLALLTLPALVGGLAGAILLLRTPTRTFSALVPFLVLGATLLLLVQGWIARRTGAPGPEDRPRRFGAVSTIVGQLLVSVYGGYFGAGMGIMMLALLGLWGMDDIHQKNGLKNLLAAIVNSAAAVFFAISGAVRWTDAIVLALGALLGGYGGARLARRLGRTFVHRAVVVIGLGLSLLLFLR